MATATKASVAQVSHRLNRTATAVEQANVRAVSRAALIAKREIESERDKAVGSDGRMSHVGRSGAKLGVRYDVRGVKNPVAVVKATGPWPLIERPIGAHSILPRRAKGSRRRGGKRALTIAGADGPRASARHPGTRGKQPWRKGVDSATPKVRAELQQTVVKAFREAMT